MKKKKILLTAACAVLILSATIGSAVAYFSTYEKALGGYVLHLDDYEEYTEEFQDWTKKVVITSKKDSKEDVYVRVRAYAGTQVKLQYIADDSKLMLNLQTVTEDLGTACGGKAWIIVTSQQDIDSITQTMGEDFSKIQGRFATRIALSGADAAEVIKKRILYKKPEARPILENLYKEYEPSIKNIITLLFTYIHTSGDNIWTL